MLEKSEVAFASQLVRVAPPNLRELAILPAPPLPLQLPLLASHPQGPLPSLSASSHLTIGSLASNGQAVHGGWLAAAAAAHGCSPQQLAALKARADQMYPAVLLPRDEALVFLAEAQPPIAPASIANFMANVWKGPPPPGRAPERGGSMDGSLSLPLDADGRPSAARTPSGSLHDALVASHSTSQAEPCTLGYSSTVEGAPPSNEIHATRHTQQGVHPVLEGGVDVGSEALRRTETAGTVLMDTSDAPSRPTVALAAGDDTNGYSPPQLPGPVPPPGPTVDWLSGVPQPLDFKCVVCGGRKASKRVSCLRPCSGGELDRSVAVLALEPQPTATCPAADDVAFGSSIPATDDVAFGSGIAAAPSVSAPSVSAPPVSAPSVSAVATPAISYRGVGLPEGWTCERHEAPSGSYQRYRSHTGERVQSITEAWRRHNERAAAVAPSSAPFSTTSTSTAHTFTSAAILPTVPRPHMPGAPGAPAVEVVDGLQLERSSSTSTGYRGVYRSHSKQCPYMARGLEGVPVSRGYGVGAARAAWRAENRFLGTYRTAREAATAVAKHAISVETWLEWQWQLNEAREAERVAGRMEQKRLAKERHEREAEQRKQLQDAKRARTIEERTRKDEERAALKAERAAQRAAAVVARKAAKAEAARLAKAEAARRAKEAKAAAARARLAANLPWALRKLAEGRHGRRRVAVGAYRTRASTGALQDSYFSRLSLRHRSVLVRWRGGKAPILPIPADAPDLAREWEAVQPSPYVLEQVIEFRRSNTAR